MGYRMQAAVRPWFTTGVALVGASAIAMAPIAPLSPAAAMRDVSTSISSLSAEVQLTDIEIPYILSLPIVRQSIRNWSEIWAVYLGGFAQAGTGLVQSLLAIPGVTIEVIQEVLALDFVAAFETVTGAIRDSVVAVGQPLLDSLIWRNQKYAAVQTELRAAWPQAIIDVANGFLEAGNVVTVSLIAGTQNFVGAVLTFDLGNVVDAAVDGTRNFVVALGDGARAIVDGIESAQLGLATALATNPPSSAVADGPASLAAPPKTVVLDTVAPDKERPETLAATASDLSVASTDEDAPPAKTSKKPARANPVKDLARQLGDTVTKVTDQVTAGLKSAVKNSTVRKGGGLKKDRAPEKDTETTESSSPAAAVA